MTAAFLRHRASPASVDAPPRDATGPEQIRAIVVHAARLADRLEALPLPADDIVHRQRQDRVRRLRQAVAAGERALSAEAGRVGRG